MQHVFFTTKGNMKQIHYTESINYEIERTARAIKLLGVQLFNTLKINISPDEYCALDVIINNDNICQRDLAKFLLKDRANTGRVLNSLEQRGFIARYNDTKNNRLVRKVTLTEKGKTELTNVNSIIEEYLKNQVRPFSEEEIRQVHMTVKKFRENLEGLLKLNI